MTPPDLPEAANRRLTESAFSSGLSVPDFAACLAMGLQPVGLVQGFCAMQGGWAMSGIGLVAQGGYSENFPCPHGGMLMGGEHRAYGQNYELTSYEEGWATGYQTSLARLVEEATALGAHGVVGVIDTESELADAGIVEYHTRGTAVVVRGAPAPTHVWTTELAGQRLAKAFEAGFAPVASVATVAVVRMWAGCITMYQLEGRAMFTSGAPSEIEQVVSAQSTARQIARERARHELGHDDLHGVTWRENGREGGNGVIDFAVTVRGSRLRRAGAASPLAPPELLRVLS